MARARRHLIVGLVIAVVAIGAWAAVVFIRAVLDVPRQAYAVWWTADSIIAYMERHDGAWPRSWEDLRTLAAAAPEVSESTGLDGFLWAQTSDFVRALPKALRRGH